MSVATKTSSNLIATFAMVVCGIREYGPQVSEGLPMTVASVVAVFTLTNVLVSPSLKSFLMDSVQAVSCG